MVAILVLTGSGYFQNAPLSEIKKKVCAKFHACTKSLNDTLAKSSCNLFQNIYAHSSLYNDSDSSNIATLKQILRK